MIRSHIALLNLSIVVGSLAVIAGCGADTGDPGPSNPAPAEHETVPSTIDPATTPTPVATLRMPSGSVVEFYDLGVGAVISESAAAYTQPSLQLARGKHDANEIAAIWRSLAPNEPVPAALMDLQKRLTNLAPSAAKLASPTFGAEDGQPEPMEIDPSGSLLAQQIGCANGCCDEDWLNTFEQCSPQGVSFSMFHFNYGWSSLSTGSQTAFYNSLVCSGRGTSTYTVRVADGGGGTWSVTEAHFRTFWWLAGTVCNPFCDYDEQNVDAFVNKKSATHLHSFCAYAIWD